MRTVKLSVEPLLSTTIDTTVCVNELPYTWYGHIFTAAVQVIDTVSSTTGFDTIRTLNLSVAPLLTTTIDTTVCANELPYTWYGHIFTAAGQVIDTVSSITGCDTIRTLNLDVAPLHRKSIENAVCVNELPYTWYD